MNGKDESRPSAAEVAVLPSLIRKEAETEVAQLQGEALRRAQEVRGAAEVEARLLREAAQQEGERHGRRRGAELLAAADAEARLEALRDREALIAAVLERARERLDEWTTLPQPADVLAALVREGLAVIAERPLVLHVATASGAIFDEVLRGAGFEGVVARIETNLPGGGVVVETPEGRLRFDNSFASRMARSRERLRRVVGDLLFAEESET